MHTAAERVRVALWTADRAEYACPQLRFAIPFAAAPELELCFASEHVGVKLALDVAAARNADVVAMARFLPHPATWSFIEQLLRNGPPIVYELDDLLLEIPRSNPCHGAAQVTRPCMIELLRRAAAVTTTTPALRDALAGYRSDVLVLPNAVDPALFQSRPRERGSRFTVAYVGTDTHGPDLASIEPALLDAAAQLGNELRVLLFGCATESLRRLPQCEVVPFEPSYRSYARRLRDLGIDLALAPLVDNPFNRCKSHVKWLEFSAAGVPGIYADLPPYRDHVADGETGLLRGADARGWRDAILELARDEPRRRALAERAQRVVLAEHSVARGAERWAELYRSLARRQPAPARPRPRAPADAPVCSIVIPVFNRVELTRGCLEALEPTTRDVAYELIVVDNGSSDGTRELLDGLGPRARVIRNDSNRGFGPACNQGAALARGEHIVLLNNDTVPLEGWLGALVEAARSAPDVGIVGSRLLFPDGSIQHAGVVVGRRHLTPYHIYRGVSPEAPFVSRRRELRAMTGACMLVRRALFEELGGLDEGYRNGFEDIDLCFRAGERGWRILYEPKSTLYHLESQTPGRKQHDRENLDRFFARWSDPRRVDEDLVYYEDGFWIRIEEREGRLVLLYRPLDDAETRERWARVAEVQRRALRGGAPAARELLEDPWAFPGDPDLLSWLESLCSRGGLPDLASRFAHRREPRSERQQPRSAPRSAPAPTPGSLLERAIAEHLRSG